MNNDNDLKSKVNKINNEKMNSDEEMLKWSPEDRFYFSGNEFGSLVNTLKNVCESSTFIEDLMKARQTIAVASAYEIVKKKLDSCLSSGQIRKLSKEQFELEEQLQEQKEQKLPELIKE